MKNSSTLIISSIIIFFVFSLSCQNQTKNGYGDVVSVSILPQKFVVDKIAEGRLEVNVLVPPGAKPETYSLLPSQMKALSKSKVWLRIGHIGFEETWQNRIAETNPNLNIVDCSKGIKLIRELEEHEGHKHADGVDPHIWMAPDEMKIITRNTLEALIAAFPEKEMTYKKNAGLFIAEIDSVKNLLNSELRELTNREFLIFHPGLGYFARAFNLTQTSLEMEGKEPSPRYMKEIIDGARSKKITTIFIQKEFDQQNAKQFSKEINGKIIAIDPLDYLWTDQMIRIGKHLTEEISP